jgi:hypothetical protein
MAGKRVQLDDETWEAIHAVMRDSGNNFQELADEAFADLLKKHKQPVGLRAALKESVRKHRKRSSCFRTQPNSCVAARDIRSPEGSAESGCGDICPR